jgi:penicillin-binding protein 1C
MLGFSISVRRRLKRVAVVLAAAAAAGLVLALAAFHLASWIWPFPSARLAQWPASPMVTDRSGRHLLSLVGIDEQWRFPVKLDDVSPHVRNALVAVEDERFYTHCGVDLTAVARAVAQNVGALRVVSGASTLTMQVCRMLDDRPRTLGAKAVESFRALQLERLMSKDAILETYLNIAPFGGNVRGIEAAALFYFVKSAADVSLEEATLLAGLPQSPAQYHPNRHPVRARTPRDFVLGRIRDAHFISAEECDRARLEEVHLSPWRRPVRAPHAAWLALSRSPSGCRTTIDVSLQRDVERLALAHDTTLPAEATAAVVVIDIPTGDVVALVGGTDPSDSAYGQVNVPRARRSPGSALKPFIYAAAFAANRLAPDSILFDVPINRGGWTPSNYDRTFRGEVQAAEALRASLNVPAILVAEGVGLHRCLGTMRACGVPLQADAAVHAGLGVAVGCVEVTLLDLTNAYATLGRQGHMRPWRIDADEPIRPSSRALPRGACRVTNDVLSVRRRRANGLESHHAEDVPWFMWKTGTSSAERDALAVGHNGRYAVGVWVGCLDGASHAEFIGAEVAEPLLAELFCLPRLARDATDPPPPPRISVRRPLPRPAEAQTRLRILVPANGAEFQSCGTMLVRPRANRDGRLTWFANGKVVDAGCALPFGPGQHVLRCITGSGESDAVMFTVR